MYCRADILLSGERSYNGLNVIHTPVFQVSAVSQANNIDYFEYNDPAGWRDTHEFAAMRALK